VTTTLIQGGTVVAFREGAHRLLRAGQVLCEDGQIAFVGAGYAGPADVTLDASDCLIIPGLVDIHCHAGSQAGERMIADVGDPQFFQAGFLNYWAVPSGKEGPVGLEEAGIGAVYTLAELLRGGTTTVLELGSASEAFAQVAADIGIRLYAGAYCASARYALDEPGTIVWDWNEARGFAQLEQAERVLKAIDGMAGGRIRGMLCPAQADTCSPELLHASRAAAERLGVLLQIHTAQNVMELQRMLAVYGKTPVAFLDDLGMLGPKTILGHCILTSAHSLARLPEGDDLERIARAGSPVAHCPLVFARRGNLLESFDRYRAAGITVGIGTDTYPRDMLSEMRLAAFMAKVAERSFAAGQARDVFNAATLGGCRVLAREDLGRLAPGARADILLINLDHLGGPVYADPI
jgi:cytosine/adenosine deaminase-related metal-dependent hydrolase